MGGDAPGGTLANARPLAFRPDTGLPYLGEVGVDLNDINNPELVAIMIHEFGHALGMPGASSFQTFIVGDYFTGPNAVREYESIFGASADTNGVPLETGGGGGTAGAHWSEAEFGNELMTGYLSATNLISTVTVGAFEDVGYDVDYTAADPYTAPSNLHGISSPDMSGLRPCGCAFCQPVNSSSLSSSSLEQEQVITTPTLRITATGTGETIDISTDVTTFGGSADGNITIQEANTISLGETTPGTLFPNVSSTSGSITVTAAGRITANNVQATDLTNGAINFTSTGSGVTLGAINTQTTTVNANGDVNDVIDLKVTSFANLVGGNGYTPFSTTIPVTFSASPTGDTATGSATSDGFGVIIGITIANPGSGYTTTPTIVIDEPTTGTRATATAVTTGGNRVITSPTLVVNANGSPIVLGTNSHVVDTLSATSDTFTRATGTTTLSSTGDADFVDSVVITNGASGYSPNATNIPVTFEASPTGDTATGYATADAGGVVTGVTITNPGSGYTTAPTITFASTVHALVTATLGTDEVASAAVDFNGSGYTPLANIPVIFQASPTSDTATGYATTDPNGEIVSLTITHSGSGYVSAPLVVVDPPATSGDSSLRGNIEFKATNGLIIDTVVGKEISLTADDTVTDLNYIIGEALTVTSLSGKDITLENLNNQIAAFGAVTDDSAGTKGDVTLTSTLQDVTLTGITADTIDILVYGNVNDSNATDGTTLSIVAGGTVELDTATNDVDTLTVVDTAVDTVTINNGGSGYTPGTVAVTFAPPPITNIVINTPGSGYAINDANIPVTFDASPTGDTATGVASSDGTGQITSVKITNPGSGYTSTPTLTISAPPSGTRAEASISDDVTTGFATADSSGVIVLITITNPGSGYLSAPSLVIDPPTSGAQATATATNLLPSAVTFVDADDLNVTGIVAGAVTLQTATQLTQTGAIQTGTLSVTSGAMLTLTNTENDADVISITNPGFDATIYDIDDLQIGDPGITANNVVFEIAGDLTQESSSSVLVTDLRVIGSRGVVELTSTTNAIGAISVAGTPSENQQVADVLLPSGGGSGYTPDQTDIPVVFDPSPTGDTATGYATADAAGIITTITITNPGSGYDSSLPPTATVTAPAVIGGMAPTVSVVLASQDITIVNSTATNIGSQGLQSPGSAVSITSVGALTQSGDIISKSLSATSDADIVLTNGTNNVDDFSGVSTSGDVSYSEMNSVNIVAAGGNIITLEAQNSLTQTGAVTGTTLKITGASDVTFTSPDNDVDTLEASGIYSANSNGFGLEYVDQDDLTVDGVAATAGSISITSGDTLTIDSTVVAGTAIANDGDILLEAQDGNLEINGDITSEADRVILKATAGQINHTSGTITTETLIWYATVSPTFGTLVYSIEGPNLTGPGNLFLDRLGLGTVEIAGASVVDGNVSIVADSLILSELVRAAGTGNDIAIQTNVGSIDIQGNGRLESESGDITVAAATDFIVSNHALDGNGDPTTVSATATAGTLVIKKPTATATATLNVDAVDTSVTVDFDGLGYTPSSTTIPVTFSASPTGDTAIGVANSDINGVITSIAVTHPGSGYILAPTITIDDPTSGPVVKNPAATATATLSGDAVNSSVVVDFGSSGYTPNSTIPVTFSASPTSDTATGVANSDINGVITSITVTHPGSGYVTAPTTTIDEPTSDVFSTDVQKIDVTASSSLNILEANAIELVNLTTAGNPITLQAGGITQSGALIASSLTVTNTAGSVVLDQNNDVATVTIANPVGDVTYNTNRATATDIAGIQGVNVDLDSENGFTQSGVITAMSLDVTNTVAGNVVLDQNNDVATVAIANTVGDVTYNTNRVGSTATATATLTGDAVNTPVTVDFGGLGYTPSSTTIPVTFSAPPTGTTATGVANSDVNGVITSITVTNPGSGYTIAPTITIGDPLPLPTDIAGIQGLNVDLDSENGFTQSGAITATSLDVTNTVAGNVVLDQNNNVATVAISNALGDVTYNTNRGTTTDVAGIQGVNVDLDSENGFTQSGAITATSLDVTNTVAGNVVLDQNNDVATVAISNAVGDVTYNTNRATATDIAGIQGVNVDLDSENGFTQSGAITATSLDVTNTVAGDVVLDQNNDVATVTITNTVGDVTYTTISSSITDINGIQGVNIVLNSDNGVSQSAAITATNSLTVTNAVSGNVVLDQNNDVAIVAIVNPVGDVTYNTNRATATDIAGIQGVNVDLDSENGFTQSGAITATSLDVTNTVDGDVVLANSSNDVDSLSVINTGRSITYFDSDDLILTQLDGNPITITAGGSVSQVNDISGVDLTVTVNGSINLSNPNNSLSTVALSSSDNDISFFNNKSVVIAAPGIDAGTGNIEIALSDGDLSQVGQIIGSSLVLAITDGDVTLLNASNDVDEIAALLDGTGRSISFTDTDDLIIGGSNAIQGIAGENTVSITSGGDLVQTKDITAGTLNLVAGGNYSQTGSTNVTGDIDIDAIGAITQTASTATIDAANLDMNAGTSLALAGTTTVAGTVGLTAGGDITQAAAITAGTLNLVAGGNYSQTGSTNVTGDIDIDATGAITQTASTATIDAANLDMNAGTSLALAGTTTVAGTVGLTAGGDITQAAAIKTNNLEILNTGSSVVLTNTSNEIQHLQATNSNRNISVRSVVLTEINGTGIDGASVNLITAGLHQTAPIKATSLDITNTANNIVLNATNEISSFEISNAPRSVELTNTIASSISAGGIQASTVKLNTAGLTQTGVITATSLDVTNSAGTVVLDKSNALTNVEIDNTGRDITLTNSAATNISAGGIQGDSFKLNTAGLTQAGVISATSLDVTNSAGTVVLDKSNVLTHVEIDNTGRTVNLTNSAATNISAGGIQGSTVVLNTAGLTQAGAITATSLDVTNSAGNVVLNQSNTLTNVEIDNTGRDIALTNSATTNISAGGFQGDTVLLNTAGLSQAGAITATSLDVTNSAGTVVLVQSNALTNVEIDNTGRNVSLTNSAATNISTGGIQGDSVVLNTAGLSQAGAITATSLDVTNSASTVALTNNANSLANVEIDNTGRNVSLTNSAATNISAGGIQGNSVVLSSAGLTQTGAITTTSLDVTNSAGSVALDQSNTLTDVEIDNTGRSISLTNSAATNISAGGIQGSFIAIKTTNGLTQTGTIASTGVVSVSDTNGPVQLTQANTIAGIEITSSGLVAVKNTVPMSINGSGINSGVLNLDITGDLTALSDINSTTFDATVDGKASFTTITTSVGDIDIDATGEITVQNSLTSEGTISVGSGGGVTLNEATSTTGGIDLTGSGDIFLTGKVLANKSLIIDATGAVTVSDATAEEMILIDAGGDVDVATELYGKDQILISSSGDFNVSTLTDGVAKSDIEIDLRLVDGDVRLINGGIIDAPSVLLREGASIGVGVPAENSTALDRCLDSD